MYNVLIAEVCFELCLLYTVEKWEIKFKKKTTLPLISAQPLSCCLLTTGLDCHPVKPPMDSYYVRVHMSGLISGPLPSLPRPSCTGFSVRPARGNKVATKRNTFLYKQSGGLRGGGRLPREGGISHPARLGRRQANGPVQVCTYIHPPPVSVYGVPSSRYHPHL